MCEIVRVVYLTGALDVAAAVSLLRTNLADLPCSRSIVAATLPGSRNGGNLIVRLRFDSMDAWLTHRDRVETALAGADASRVVGAALAPAQARARWTGRRDGTDGPGVYRILLAKVADGTTAAEVARFERALLQMPDHIPQIRAWRLSRVEESVGPTAWTHAWEQEYNDVDGLLGAYMNHPIHWAYVDRWFDPESPLQLVRERVCHTFCSLERPILSV